MTLTSAGRRAMEYFTLRNTAIVGLVQVGLITATVLGSGATLKLYRESDATPAQATVLVDEYGGLALLVPVAWASWASWLLYAGEDDEAARAGTLVSGLLLAALFLFIAFGAVVAPWFRLAGADF